MAQDTSQPHLRTIGERAHTKRYTALYKKGTSRRYGSASCEDCEGLREKCVDTPIASWSILLTLRIRTGANRLGLPVLPDSDFGHSLSTRRSVGLVCPLARSAHHVPGNICELWKPASGPSFHHVPTWTSLASQEVLPEKTELAKRLWPKTRASKNSVRKSILAEYHHFLKGGVYCPRIPCSLRDYKCQRVATEPR